MIFAFTSIATCIYFLFLFYNSTCTVGYKIMTKSQWNTIQNYYLDKQIKQIPSMMEKIGLIIYSRHQPLLKSTVHEFRRFHKFKCNHIPTEDLEQYASMGLMHAIRNYNGKSLFHPYAKIYITGALYKGLTKQYPISKRSAKERRKRQLPKPYDFETCKIDSTNIESTNWYLGKMDYLVHLQNQCPHLYRDMWIRIYNLPPTMRRIIEMKYDYEFNVVRSNEEISEYFGCSEETIRKNVILAIENITENSIEKPNSKKSQ